MANSACGCFKREAGITLVARWLTLERKLWASPLRLQTSLTRNTTSSSTDDGDFTVWEWVCNRGIVWQ